jgi:hypothetical protein
MGPRELTEAKTERSENCEETQVLEGMKYARGGLGRGYNDMPVDGGRLSGSPLWSIGTLDDHGTVYVYAENRMGFVRLCQRLEFRFVEFDG